MLSRRARHSILDQAVLAPLLAVSSAICFAVPQQADGKRDSPATTSYSDAPYTGTVPPGFAGNDARAVIAALDKLPKANSEFETTAQFAKRLNDSLEAPLYGSIRTSSTLAFVFPSGHASSPAGLRASYDADSETMTAEIPFSGMLREGNGYAPQSRAIVWSEQSDSGETYTATNAYGAVVQVKKVKQVITSLSFNLPSPYYYGTPGRHESEIMGTTETVTFKVPPDKARLLKPNLRFAVVVKLAGWRTLSYDNYSPATLDSPLDLITINRYLRCDIQDIFVFDQSTGEILARLPRHEVDDPYANQPLIQEQNM